ncbi:MAG: peptide deformylase [Spirochaetaceae bacterium]|nr:MAG: peptide deformylase [Spirochaetaceae bacterium]
MLSLCFYPDELLYKKSEPVREIDDELKTFAKQMIETMHKAKGIGLAGVQVGRLMRIFVTHVERDKPRVFINPQIIETSPETRPLEEGCLSIPGIYADVVRASALKVQAWNERGRPFTIDADGILARVILHEYDHLNGVLFLDHLAQDETERLLETYSREDLRERANS